jgi:hypothetical protein
MSKSLIKVPVPPAFLLEWFLKSLVPQLSKDVATSGVFSEEEAIMRAQQLELIYSQSGLLYEFFQMHHGPSLTRPDKSLDHMPMVLLVQHKKSPLISCQINCNNCRYNRQRPARPLVRLLPLPKRQMYTVCNRQTQRPTNSLKERRNNETRRVRGIRNPPIMLRGKHRKESRSIHVTKSYWHNNNLLC